MRFNYGKGTQYPTVNLAVRKSRLKMYGSTTINPTYYLNSGQEFQIELFNPTTDVVLAKISLNGKLISNSGLVVKPGERVFLDRFLDENKKFLFETYKVDNIEEVKQAIKDNGDLEVSFYKEKLINIPDIPKDIYIPICGDNITTFNTTGGYQSPTFTTTSTFDSNTGTSIDLNGSIDNSVDDTLAFYSQSIPVNKPIKRKKSLKKIETGRVGKGSSSKQKIETVDMEFEAFPFHTVSYKMKPMSQKKITSDEVINKYCPNCGKKNKPTNKFCPNCGAKR